MFMSNVRQSHREYGNIAYRPLPYRYNRKMSQNDEALWNNNVCGKIIQESRTAKTEDKLFGLPQAVKHSPLDMRTQQKPTNT